jgi:peptidoglycan/xylan/chitin deacetylase (PgdA/CDA1 family)
LSHSSLVDLPLEQARSEIADSRRLLEDLVERPITAISYPFGKYDNEAKTLVQDAGYRSAVTTKEALISTDPDWFALPRVSINRNVGAMQFRAKLTPAIAVYESWRGRK